MRLKSMRVAAVGPLASGRTLAGIGPPDLTPIRSSRAMEFSTVHLAGDTILRGSFSEPQHLGTSAASLIIISGHAIARHTALGLASRDTLPILVEEASILAGSVVCTAVAAVFMAVDFTVVDFMVVDSTGAVADMPAGIVKSAN